MAALIKGQNGWVQQNQVLCPFASRVGAGRTLRKRSLRRFACAERMQTLSLLGYFVAQPFLESTRCASGHLAAGGQQVITTHCANAVVAGRHQRTGLHVAINHRLPAEHNAMPGDRQVHQHRLEVDGHALAYQRRIDPLAGEPVAPGQPLTLPVFEHQQAMIQQLRGLQHLTVQVVGRAIRVD